MRGATRPDCLIASEITVSIHAPRAGRDTDLARAKAEYSSVSIHAPRAGRDLFVERVKHIGAGFNPRAPCGARHNLKLKTLLLRKFQSTRPVRGATFARLMADDAATGFNPRAPCGARPGTSGANGTMWVFQSTRPVRGATSAGHNLTALWEVSIHAPRAGRDRPATQRIGNDTRFNPRAPCGARRWVGNHYFEEFRFNPRAPCGARPRFPSNHGKFGKFQSTRPVRGATLLGSRCEKEPGVSIHAPRAGRDHQIMRLVSNDARVSIHAPRAGRDGFTEKIFSQVAGFQSTRPVRGATFVFTIVRSGKKFQSTRPVRGAT